MKVASKFKQISGVEFELTVRDESAGYFGAWFCRNCMHGGVDYQLLPSVDDAMSRAEQDALQHVETSHASP